MPALFHQHALILSPLWRNVVHCYYFYRTLHSRLFKFIVSEKVDGSATEFLIQEGAISQLSELLYKLIKGVETNLRPSLERLL